MSEKYDVETRKRQFVYNGLMIDILEIRNSIGEKSRESLVTQQSVIDYVKTVEEKLGTIKEILSAME